MVLHTNHVSSGYCVDVTGSLINLHIPRMRPPHVLRQVAGLRERLAARLTHMRLLPRMRAHVHSQAAGLGERLAARVADMRLLENGRSPVRWGPCLR